jgi:hypothetical protein
MFPGLSERGHITPSWKAGDLDSLVCVAYRTFLGFSVGEEQVSPPQIPGAPRYMLSKHADFRRCTFPWLNGALDKPFNLLDSRKEC